MKQLDWKSFAIGVLLTTTVMLGTGAATSANEKWDSKQKWVTKSDRIDTVFETEGDEGFEPLAASGNIVVWRKRIK